LRSPVLRPQLAKLLKRLDRGDVLTVTRLDRLINVSQATISRLAAPSPFEASVVAA
jgi:DNA invertase Pin-like site-specific DNA recombinase